MNMKRSVFGHKILASVFLCCLIAALKVEGRTLSDKHQQQGNNKNHHQPLHCFCCIRCRLLHETILPPPMDTRFNIQKRFVPGGPNPLHNWILLLCCVVDQIYCFMYFLLIPKYSIIVLYNQLLLLLCLTTSDHYKALLCSLIYKMFE